MSTRVVMCDTADCENQGVGIEVEDDGTRVVCGPCGVQLEEQAEWFIPDADEGPTAADVAGLIGAMSASERSALISALAGGAPS